MQVADLLALAQRHHHENEFARAEALYQQILAQQPNHPRALFLLGTLKLQTQRTDEAIALLTEAARQSPDDVLVHSNLGAACQMAGDLDAAIVAQQRAVALAPNDAQSQMNLALALRGRGRFD